MALLWMDGFDHYGSGTVQANTGRTNMLKGAWASADTNCVVSTTKPRNGYASVVISTTANVGMRRVFGGSYNNAAVGVATAWYTTSLPDIANSQIVLTFTDQANDEQVSIIINTDGTIKAVAGTRSSTTVLGTSASPVITASTWHHIEARLICHASTGALEVRVDGVAAIGPLTNIDTDPQGTSEVSQAWFGLVFASGTAGPQYIDDCYAWDGTGSYNNDFIGDKDILTYYYDGDTGTQQWTPNVAVAHHLQVDDTESSQSPASGNDGDTTYLQATSAGNIEELDLEAVPSTVAGIVGVQLVNMMRKTQAGASNVTAVIVEGTITAESTGTSTELGEEYAYYQEVIERNPVNGTDQWRYDTLSDCKLKLTRDT